MWASSGRRRRTTRGQRIESRPGTTEAVIHAADRKRILKEPALGGVAELRRHWTVAVSTEPLSRAAAVASLSAVRHVLSVIPVKVPAPLPSPEPSVTFEEALVHA
jgi:hypothetical protein